VSLYAGLAIVRGRSNGTANFMVSFVTPDPGATVSKSYDNRSSSIQFVHTTVLRPSCSVRTAATFWT
jgi:hypothetical protein